MANAIDSPKAYCDSLSLQSLKVASEAASASERTTRPACLEAGSVEDSVDVGMEQVYKSLAVLSDKVLKKLEEVLGENMPRNVGTAIPEEYTPENTAQRIVDGVIGLLSVYAKQNSGKSDEEMISGFMAAVRQGVEQGYGEARDILEAIDALKIDGVSSTIEETLSLVGQKLDAFETTWRKEHGLEIGGTEEGNGEE